MKKAVRTIAISAAVIAIIAAALWAIPLPAGVWHKQEMSAGYTGDFIKNDKLASIELIGLGGYSHPETVLIRDGWLYSSAKGGVILKMREDGSGLTKLLDTGGCILGFDFDAEGNIIAADCCYRGTGAILKVSGDGSGGHEVLLSSENGMELCYPNGLAIASDGTIYITDSSSAFPPVKYGGSSSSAAANEGMMHTCTGRVIAFYPDTGEVRVIAGGLAFANGLGLSDDQRSLFVCETYAYAITRVDIETGGVSSFITNLPGFPDNITKGLDGRFWVGLNGERSDALDAISGKPFLRKCIWLYNKLTSADESAAIGYCHVFAFTQDGSVTESLQSGGNGYYRSTGAAETEDRLYVSSINDSGHIAYIVR